MFFLEPKFVEKNQLISSLVDSVVASKKNAKPWDFFVDLIKDSGKSLVGNALLL